MLKLTEKGTEALQAIKDTKLNSFTAKELSTKSGKKITAQALCGLASRGILEKTPNTSPVVFKLIATIEKIAENDVKLKNLGGGNRYAHYKTLIENRILNNIQDIENIEYMFTLKGKYIEMIKWDTSGKNFPKVKPFMLDKIVDDIDAFKQAWSDLMSYHLEVLD